MFPKLLALKVTYIFRELCVKYLYFPSKLVNSAPKHRVTKRGSLWILSYVFRLVWITIFRGIFGCPLVTRLSSSLFCEQWNSFASCEFLVCYPPSSPIVCLGESFFLLGEWEASLPRTVVVWISKGIWDTSIKTLILLASSLSLFFIWALASLCKRWNSPSSRDSQGIDPRVH